MTRGLPRASGRCVRAVCAAGRATPRCFPTSDGGRSRPWQLPLPFCEDQRRQSEAAPAVRWGAGPRGVGTRGREEH